MTEKDVQDIKDGIAHTLWTQERILYLIEESVIGNKRFGSGAFTEDFIAPAMKWASENASPEAIGKPDDD